jgi:hypothetical protein
MPGRLRGQPRPDAGSGGRGDGTVDVVDQVQGLGQNDAVEISSAICGAWMRSPTMVAPDCGRGHGARPVGSRDRRRSGACTRHLRSQCPTGDVAPVRLEETLDVIAVDRQAAVVPNSRLTGSSRRRPPQSHRSVSRRA